MVVKNYLKGLVVVRPWCPYIYISVLLSYQPMTEMIIPLGKKSLWIRRVCRFIGVLLGVLLVLFLYGLNHEGWGLAEG